MGIYACPPCAEKHELAPSSLYPLSHVAFCEVCWEHNLCMFTNDVERVLSGRDPSINAQLEERALRMLVIAPEVRMLRFNRGLQDGEKGRAPTEGTEAYLYGYRAGRQKWLDRQPPKW